MNIKEGRGSGRRVRVRVSWLSRSTWLCRWASGLACKLERTKTGLIRVRAVYFSGNQASMSATLDRLHHQGFEFKAERRDSRYCSGSQEYRVSGKVGMMQAIEGFILKSFWQKQQTKVATTFIHNGRAISIA